MGRSSGHHECHRALLCGRGCIGLRARDRMVARERHPNIHGGAKGIACFLTRSPRKTRF